MRCVCQAKERSSAHEVPLRRRQPGGNPDAQELIRVLAAGRCCIRLALLQPGCGLRQLAILQSHFRLVGAGARQEIPVFQLEAKAQAFVQYTLCLLRIATVQGDEASAAAPAPDVAVDATEFAFVLPDELAGGAQWWQIDNKGVQAHDLSIFALSSEVTIEVLQAQMEVAEAEGHSLGAGVKMPVWITGAGQSTQLKVDLPPGQYVLFYQAPDFSTLPPGPRHWHKGMMRTFTVVE